MVELKTTRTKQSVAAFLNSIEDKQIRADCKTIAALMRHATGQPARMWGNSIVGFGSYDYKYESGREGTWFLCGFSPRKRNLSLYVMPGFSKFPALMKKLGKHKTGKSCLYINGLKDVDQSELEALIEQSVKHMRERYSTR